MDVGVFGDSWDVLVGGDCCVGCLKILPTKTIYVDYNILLRKWLKLLLLVQKISLTFFIHLHINRIQKIRKVENFTMRRKMSFLLNSCLNI